MSDYIPLELQVEIIKKLPVKSLIQFRSVSKAWKSLIDRADFVKHYSNQLTNRQHLFLTYYDCKDEYISIADDHTFPHHKVHLTLPPWLLDYDYELIGCSHGLLCFYYPQQDDHINIALLWNFSIRKAFALVVPNVVNNPIDDPIYTTVIGFGVCRETTDPKIVKITQFIRGRETDNASFIPWQVEVFTLSTRAWRAPYSTNLPPKSITLGCFYQVVEVAGFVYWLATNRITADGGFKYYNLIISFDITSEEFREVNTPNGLAAHQFSSSLSLSKLRESLVVLKHGVEANNRVIVVWMMEDGGSNLFTKLFTIIVNTQDATVKGFTKSGEPIISFSKDGRHGVFYEPYSKHSDKVATDQIACKYPYSKHSDKVVIDYIWASYYLISYMETLLLLNEPDVGVHNDMETLKFEDDLLLEPNFSF